MRKIALLGFFALVTTAVPASAKSLREWNNFIIAPEQIIKCYYPNVQRWKAKIVKGEVIVGNGVEMDKYSQRSQLVEIIYKSAITGINYMMLAGVTEENGRIFAIPALFAQPIVNGSPDFDYEKEISFNYECNQLGEGVPVKDIPQGKHPASSTPPP